MNRRPFGDDYRAKRTSGSHTREVGRVQAIQVEQLLGCYGTEIYRYSRRLTGFGPDGEDLYQQTFLRMLELDLTADESRSPRALLYSVATMCWKPC